MGTSELPPAPRLPSHSGEGRRAARARGLSRDAIAAAALRIVDADGLDALTMRAVATALGTGAASLYAHVSGKDELLELVIERVIGEVPYGGEEPDPGRWPEQLKDTVRNVRSTFAAHRDLARASFARIPLGENAIRGAEWMIGVMRAGRLPDQVAAWACDLLSLYAMAIAYEDSLWDRELTVEEIEGYLGSMRTYFASLPVDRFPGVVALAGPLTSGDGDERFEFGLEVLIRGLAAMADSPTMADSPAMAEPPAPAEPSGRGPAGSGRL